MLTWKTWPVCSHFFSSNSFLYSCQTAFLHPNICLGHQQVQLPVCQIQWSFLSPHLPDSTAALDLVNPSFIRDSLSSPGFWAPHSSSCLLLTDSAFMVVGPHREGLMTLECPRSPSLDPFPLSSTLILWLDESYSSELPSIEFIYFQKFVIFHARIILIKLI